MKKETRSAKHSPATWLDIALCLVVGIGSPLLASFLLKPVTSFLSGEWFLAKSIITYILIAFCFGGTAYVVGVRRGKVSWAEMGFLPPMWQWRWLPMAVVILCAAIPVQALMSFLTDYLVGGYVENSSMLKLLTGGSYSFSWAGFGLAFLGAGLIAPIAEEFYFRGLLYNLLKSRIEVTLGILVGSAVFGLGHLTSVGVVISSFVFGVIASIVYERSQSIWLPIALHVIQNAFGVIAVFGLLFVKAQMGL
jgi:membrane protease YdiL (CAAX protease family)